MAEQDDLWTAVKDSYDDAGLIQLTNVDEPEATAIDDTIGTRACTKVIALWDIYAQVDYDGTDATHLAVAEMAVIAVLWRWGGTATQIEQVKWDEVFGDTGMIAKVRRAGPRSHAAPISNSGVTQKAESVGGRNVRGWSDRESLPHGILPNRTLAND